MAEKNRSAPGGADDATRAGREARLDRAADDAHNRLIGRQDDPPPDDDQDDPPPAQDDDAPPGDDDEQVDDEQPDDDDRSDDTDDTDPDDEASGARGQREPDSGKSRKGDPFTPEEERILSRARASVEDIEWYRSLSRADRERAMAPLRNAVANMDRLFGMSREERQREIGRVQADAPSRSEQSNTDDASSARIPLDQAEVAQLAEEFGVEPKAVVRMAQMLAKPLMLRESQREQERQREAQTRWERDIENAAEATYREVAKAFPRLKERPIFEALLGEADTVSLFEGKVRRGMDVRQAMLEAVRERATLKFLSDITSKRQQDRRDSRDRAVRGTAEPTSRAARTREGRPRPKPRNLDEAHGLVVAESE